MKRFAIWFLTFVSLSLGLAWWIGGTNPNVGQEIREAAKPAPSVDYTVHYRVVEVDKTHRTFKSEIIRWNQIERLTEACGDPEGVMSSPDAPCPELGEVDGAVIYLPSHVWLSDVEVSR